MKRLFTILFLSFLLPSQVTAAEINKVPEIVSEAAILMDTQSGAVLYQKNADVKMVPASLTKIATAIYAIEKGNLNDMVTVSKEATDVEGTRVYLVEGETVTLKHLLQGMLVNSGNDAAAAIAIHLDGSVESFSQQLNKYLHETIGVSSTHFTNPHGLYEENHYTTAHDLAVITNYAMKNPIFKEIFGTKELAWDGQEWDTTLVTHHLLLKGDYPYEGITGGKTGFVNEAKQTLATTAENEQIQLTAIALKADFKKQIYHDTQALLDYGFQNYRTGKIDRSSVYQLGEQKFIADKDIPITVPIVPVKEFVTSKGELKILNANGDTIQTVALREESNHLAAEGVNNSKSIDSLHSKGNAIRQDTLFIIALFALASIVLSARKWNSRI
ncbi:D-alanyl-D-alanine carboxypeptidase family protein [Bacillus benzoevorans]|uniref:D-alanyl-D-alanine carboxypeptidase n=1 Tax=Bacillus benzoevorans TaxID=1456 RepID=A0A7X0HQR8_9BACI|nr:D-alanyl-D-alanine carboxypeptidase family protein [Bacillus benzoevorans]MBB6445189.1 D-alanyl-D-alanine carboxypeptidase [Bacillus benzoevorans]